MEPFGVAGWAAAEPSRLALVAGPTRLTYGELQTRIARSAAILATEGVGPGAPLALALRNRPEFFEAALAAAHLGAQVVPVPWRAKAGEVAHYVTDSKAALLLDETSLERFVARRDAAEPVRDTPAETIDFRHYTSGTTGKPAAVVRPAPVTGETRRALARFWEVTDPSWVHLACGPLYHTAPCSYAELALALGQTVVLMERFDPTEALRLIEAERVAWSHMVPINFIRMLEVGSGGRDLSSLRKVIHAAAPCPVDVKRRIMDMLGSDVVWEYYGMTEGFATVISPEEWRAKPGSVGRAAFGSTVTIRDDDGLELPPGEVGLVYVAPRLPFAYDGDADKTAAAWRGDSFTVRDKGFMDADGYLFLTDRDLDMIITGGANVYPAEVESVLLTHPAVADCAVIGIPDAEFGEAVHAIVESRLPVTEAELVEHCRERLSSYKCPRTVAFVELLGRDDNGKVRKRELREPYWAGVERRI